MSYTVQRTRNNEIDQNLDAIKAELDALRAAIAIPDGRLIEDQVLTTADAEIFHGLSKDDVRYVVVRRSANAVVYAGAVASTRPERSITLRASATVTVDLVVF